MRNFSLLAIAAALAGSILADNSVEKHLPTVVEIRAKTSSGISAGSGFLVDSTGTVATCYHVIDGASEMEIRLSSGETFTDIRVLASDPKRDIALITFAGYGLSYLPLGDSEALHIGDAVFAVGHPNGLENTVTRGIVSAIRTVDGIKVIQTDTAEANDGATDEEQVTVEHFIELHLAEQLSIADVANLEREVPGISHAVWKWLSDINSE